MTSLLTNSHILLTLLVAICKMFSLTKKKKRKIGFVPTTSCLLVLLPTLEKLVNHIKGQLSPHAWTILDSHWRKIWQDEKEKKKKRFCCTALTIAFDHQ